MSIVKLKGLYFEEVTSKELSQSADVFDSKITRFVLTRLMGCLQSIDTDDAKFDTFGSYVVMLENCGIELPYSLVCIIAEYSFIGLLEPQHTYISDALSIDKDNPLLIHYTPQTKQSRFDYIHSDLLFPLSFNNSFYFEVKILKISKEMMKVNHLIVSFGLRSDDWRNHLDFTYDLRNLNGGMIGWEKYCIGIHSDDGYVFLNDDTCTKDGKRDMILENGFGDGDVIGCGFDGKEIYFTWNKQRINLDKKMKTDMITNKQFYAALVIHCNTIAELYDVNEFDECQFEFNFGGTPFEYKYVE